MALRTSDNQPSAGRMTHKFSFQKRAAVDDGKGNTRGSFAEQFVERGSLRPRLGGEEVLADRRRGVNLANIVVYSSSRTRAATTEWRLVDSHTSEVWNIRSIIDPDDRRIYLEMLCERGVPG